MTPRASESGVAAAIPGWSEEIHSAADLYGVPALNAEKEAD